ncbi:[FeFe] hydrogenase H-cluster radical SAM maturase HydG [Heliorestis acidaminivorans]|uniref:[FeFe] hydrogenase H-cluster radical SAM maturase HydG n=1 Tax=Heliorestis acidaminivorans TaxID=553427 RepID=A0A6I0ETE1_9FIRM|nr:[FeFe] hydrogenase H-cluster radical SAM maturase HydG [Heliorestis acidaminivorans]KAB2953339.1 [FeFe] hydrogenase H-cluster radical SAM maturase HydG [Heliorestis acidaminivorans]
MNIQLAKIYEALEKAKKLDKVLIQEIITKGKEKKGLTLQESAYLLNLQDPALLQHLYDTAAKVKEEIYGKRIVLFAPLYTSNYCINNCLYCGFRQANESLPRRRLSLPEVQQEAKFLAQEGHRRLLLVTGEALPDAEAEGIASIVESVYKAVDIRRININCAPLSVEGFRILKEAQIGTYQLFQETYHPRQYEYLHPSGPKKDYSYRLTAMNRAIEAGLDDVGLGVLFGLYDYSFEVLALLEHARLLDEQYKVGPHTISVPRIKKAPGMALTAIPAPVDDETFKKIIAILRLAVPYTGIILSTRESATLRTDLLHLGVSQLSAGSSTQPGGYAPLSKESLETTSAPLEGQFCLEDHRPLQEVLCSIMEEGFIPSFCTACYRNERTGEAFMELAKSGIIHKLCSPNALLTLEEYLIDYGNEKSRKLGQQLIKQEIEKLPASQATTLKKNLSELQSGKRDLFI